MVKIRQVDVSTLDKPKAAAATRELTPKQRERQEQQRQLARMLERITDRDAVFEVRIENDENPMTIRQRLLRAAEEQGKEIVVRKSERGWLVGLATPERRSRRGRRRGSSAQAAET
ncbi:MAG TPA: hypothetical protein VK992_03975 [Candidatus Caenarcaniphilales bacterium]|nr:hypothetical protein [Candidatus Caenarcaniphilales bacterium]